MNQVEKEELENLETVKNKLKESLLQLDERLERYARSIQEQKKYMSDHRGEMDHIEKIAAREMAGQETRMGENTAQLRNKLQKLLDIPYFGRFDFVPTDKKDEMKQVYVGIHSFRDSEGTNLIFDWRAPISSMFYEYELGQARYLAPAGEVSGEIPLKRQFRIRQGRMEFVLETGLNVVDDVLQEELSRASDERMKNIVATIQRNQNEIIRNEEAQTLIIQGVAGSGKTSIALHRIAYLLYRYKDTLTAQDILIISPNNVFSDFISNVLPELGEEAVPEMGMEGLAREILGSKFKFQTFFEQTALLLETNDEELKTRIKEKATLDFLEKLNEYARRVKSGRFRPEDIIVSKRKVPASLLLKAFNQRPSLNPAARLRWVAEVVEHELVKMLPNEMLPHEIKEIRAKIKKMYTSITLRKAYIEFFSWLGRPDLFKLATKSKFEYCDVFPLIHLKLRLENVAGGYQNVKHLLVDEMQDYTAVQYAVLDKLFKCDKTILGDANQAVNPYSSSMSELIAKVVGGSECVQLRKSYRSSYEITQFAQKISPNAELEAIERHGEEPKLVSCKNAKDEKNQILHSIQGFEASKYKTMGLICKTQKQAKSLNKFLQDQGLTVHLLTEASRGFKQGVVICAAHLSKGLEFDIVHIPFVSDENYNTIMDRNLLYVAATRAMHQLTLTYCANLSRLVQA